MEGCLEKYESILTRIVADDQSWIINAFLWIEGKTEKTKQRMRGNLQVYSNSLKMGVGGEIPVNP